MRPPDYHNHADAWIIPINRSRLDWTADWEGTLCLWLMQCRWAHPFWSWYHISGIHLRDIPGVKPAHKQFSGASHEIQILSLNPKTNHDPDRLATGEQQLDYLTPMDLCHQVGGLTDDQFKSLVTEVVLAIVDGKASPDVDYREWWKSAIDHFAWAIREGRYKAQ
jgi:hypothetical protein